MQTIKKYGRLICLTCTVLVLGSAEAAKLFAIEVSYLTGTTPTPITIENSSFPKLMKDFITGKGEFSALSDKNVFSGKIRFYGVPDVLQLNFVQLPDTTYRINISSSLTGLNKTFAGVDRETMERQIVEWFLLEGGDEAKDFLKAVALESTASISDGNPGSTTAEMADTSFALYGFYTRSSQNLNMRGHESGAHVGVNVRTRSFKSNAPVGIIEGTRTQIAVPLWLHFNQRVSYVGQLNAESISVEGTGFYSMGADMGLAVRPVVRTDDDIFGWQITPYVGAQALGSADGVTAAILMNYGLNNRFEWRISKRALISLVSQLTVLDNLTISVNDYELNTNVNQKLLKNGLLFEAPIGHLKSLYGHSYFIDSRFLEDAKISNYQTVGIGLAYVLKSFSAKAAIEYDFADKYENAGLNLGIAWDL